MAVKSLGGVGARRVEWQVTVGPAYRFDSPRVCASCGRPVARMTNAELARGTTGCCGALVDGVVAARVLRGRELTNEER